MFDFRLFPGTNFNRINLDWIFSKLKELQEGQGTVTEAAAEATAAAEEATAAAADASAAAADAIEAIETVTDAAEDAQSRATAAELTAARAEASANSAQTSAGNANTAAATAQQTADSAGTAAAAAQQTADSAGTAAAAAQQTANGAVQTLTTISSGVTNDSWYYLRIGGYVVCITTIQLSGIDCTNATGGQYQSSEIDTQKTVPSFMEQVLCSSFAPGSGSQSGGIRVHRGTLWNTNSTIKLMLSRNEPGQDLNCPVTCIVIGTYSE